MADYQGYVPSARIAAFFTLYPQALPVYEVKGKKLYMDHYEEQALKDCEVEGEPMFKVDSAAAITPQCPAMYTYSLSDVDRPINSVTLGTANTLAGADTAQDVVNMLQFVLEQNNVEIYTISVVDGSPGTFDITVSVFDRNDLDIQLDANGSTVSLALLP